LINSSVFNVIAFALDLGMKTYVLGSIGMIASVLVLSSIGNFVFAQEVTWKSDYHVGILNADMNSEIPVKITTHSKNSLKLDWQKPNSVQGQDLIGYEIQRKILNSDYVDLIKISNPKQASYIDSNLQDGYYGYKIKPILQNIKFVNVTMHGIDRENSLFSTNMEKQQSLAENLLRQNCIKCFDKSYKEISNIFQYDIPLEKKRTGSDYQLKLDAEALRAKYLFDMLFKIKTNH
jgi:hypothetical protein